MTVSKEILTHFNCDDKNCKQWFTIGDFDESFVPLCPKCGKKVSTNKIIDVAIVDDFIEVRR